MAGGLGRRVDRPLATVHPVGLAADAAGKRTRSREQLHLFQLCLELNHLRRER